MASPILATGAGAGAGLEELLTRMLRERALNEEIRHNQADEGLKGRELDLNNGLRRDALTRQTNEDAQKDYDRVTGRALQRVNLRPIGAPVPANEFSEETSHGVPTGDYSFGSPGAVPLLPKTTVDLPTPSGNVAVSDGGGPADGGLSTLPMMSWAGTPAQRKEQADANKIPADAIKPYDVGGRVTNVLVPKQAGGPLIALDGPHKGQDISSIGKPYTPPQTQIVQSGEGYFRAPKNGGNATPVLGPDNQPLGLPETTQSRAMKEGATKMQGLPDRVQALAEVLGPDQFGIVASRLRNLANKVGSLDEFDAALGSQTQGLDRTSARFLTELGFLTSGLGRVHGGARGGGSIEMINYLKGLLSDIGTIDTFKGRMDAAKDILGMYASGKLPEDDTLAAHDKSQPAAPGGLPQVGGTFNGAKVLSVTPVTR